LHNLWHGCKVQYPVCGHLTASWVHLSS